VEKGHSKARSLSRLIAANSRWRRNSFDAWRNESLKLWRNMWGEEVVARMRREQVLIGHGPAANPPKVKAGIFSQNNGTVCRFERLAFFAVF
jgi:hypothetical protein